MKRGDLYRVYKGNDTDTKDFRVFIVISRQLLIDSKFSTVVFALIYSSWLEQKNGILLLNNINPDKNSQTKVEKTEGTYAGYSIVSPL